MCHEHADPAVVKTLVRTWECPELKDFGKEERQSMIQDVSTQFFVVTLNLT